MTCTLTCAMAPPGGFFADRYRNADLLDSFGIALPPETPCDAGRLARLALSEPPLLFRALMALRDSVVSIFGIHTSGQMRHLPDPLSHIDFFPLLSASQNEVELGLDDRHLDFRTWITFRETAKGAILTSTTAVWTHNAGGRVYLAVIRPFHIAIVRASLRRVVKRLRDPAWAERIPNT